MQNEIRQQIVRSKWFSKAREMKFKNLYHHSYNEIWVSNDQVYKLTFLHDIIVTMRHEHWWIVK